MANHDSHLTPLLRMRSRLAGIVWPPLVRGDLSELANTFELLDKTQWLSAPEIAEQQAVQLQAVVAHAARHSLHFQQRLAAADLQASQIVSLDDLRRLPVLTRSELNAAGASLFCREVPGMHQPVGTVQASGRTDQPRIVQRTYINHLYWMATTLRSHAWHHADFLGRFSAVRAAVAAPITFADWGTPINLLFDSGPSQVLPANFGATQLLAELQAFAPSILSVYPSVLAALCARCEHSDHSRLKLVSIRTLGEVLPPALRERAGILFGARLSDSYSTEEVGSIATQCPVGELYHVSAETVAVEILDAEGKPCSRGDIGRVVVTDLQNFATPLIRYALGDYAEAGGPCPCGRGLPTLKRIHDRVSVLRVAPGCRDTL